MNFTAPEAQAFIETFLETKISSFQILTGGDWSAAFGFQASEQHLVVRFGIHLDDFAKDRAASRLASQDLPVPKVLAMGEAFDGYFCITERKFGVMLETLSADEMKRIVPAVFRMLDALRIADTESWCTEIGEPKESWPFSMLEVDQETDRVCGWHEKLSSHQSLNEVYEKCLGYLRSHVDQCPAEYSLRHRDLLHNNVLVSDDQITGVIDWGCARVGDYLHDVALLDFYSPWFPAMVEINWVREAKAHYSRSGVSVPDFEERLKCYGVHIGLEGMAYSAFTDDWQEVAAHSHRMSGLMARQH
jgi:hygromycin-B 4-O-kinase